MKKNSLESCQVGGSWATKQNKNKLYHIWKNSTEAEGRCGEEEKLKGYNEIVKKDLEIYSDKIKSVWENP